MKNSKEKPQKVRKLELKSGLSRRQFIVGTTAGFVTLSLGDLLWPYFGKAETPMNSNELGIFTSKSSIVTGRPKI